MEQHSVGNHSCHMCIALAIAVAVLGMYIVLSGGLIL